MALIETIKVFLIDGGNDGKPVIINKSNFDGAVHQYVRVPLNRPILVTEDDIKLLQTAADEALEATEAANNVFIQAEKNGTVEDIADAKKRLDAAKVLSDNVVEAVRKAQESLVQQDEEDDAKE